MEDLLLVAVPVALVAAVAALVKPARQRVVPVAKAVGRAGVGVAEVTAAGALGVVDAAMHGEGRQSEAPSTRAETAPAATPSGRARRAPAKASSGRARRAPAKASSGRARRRSPASPTS
jgi:hypothetical protein